VTIGDTNATIGVLGDVDYFRISLSAGQRLYFAALATGDYELETTLAVYDADENLLVQAPEWPDDNVVFNYITPSTADYFVRVKSDGYYPHWPEELTGPYQLLVRIMPEGEPNDRPETATPVHYGTLLNSDIFAPYDLDFYRLRARPGELVELTYSVDDVSWMHAYVYIESQNRDSHGQGGVLYKPGTIKFSYVVPREEDYIIHPAPGLRLSDEIDFPQAYRLDINRRSLYVAAQYAGSVNGVKFGLNDILARNTAGDWELVFNGEDVGLTVPIAGFEMTSDGAILIALKKAQSLPGIGRVKPFDIVKFIPTKLGATTRGTFSFYLRGTQAGLSLAGEQIDAIALTSAGELLISTTGIANLPGFGGVKLRAQDEDLILYHPTGPMPSAGTWSMDMDGTLFLKNFGVQDIRMVTFYNDEFVDGVTFSYRTSEILFGTNAAYRYQVGVTFGDWHQANAGDLISMYYKANGEYFPALRPPLTWPTLNFPQPIASVSNGPGWGSAAGPSTTNFLPTNDAHVNEANPTTVYGANAGLRVKNAATDLNTYIKFNVKGLYGPVQSAKIRLYVNDPGPDGGQVYPVSSYYRNTSTLWLDSGLTWNNAPLISGAPLTTIGPVTLGQWVEVDVTAAVTGNGRVSFAIANNSSDVVVYSSKEGTNSPELIVITGP
jgi:hypothetical protein